jgi:hypothetical protein
MKHLAIGMSAIVLTIGTARAVDGYPDREIGHDRSVFVDASIRRCKAGFAVETEKVLGYCECSAAALADNVTMTMLQEMVAGGLHMTPAYEELIKKSGSLCFKLITGKELN